MSITSKNRESNLRNEFDFDFDVDYETLLIEKKKSKKESL